MNSLNHISTRVTVLTFLLVLQAIGAVGCSGKTYIGRAACAITGVFAPNTLPAARQFPPLAMQVRNTAHGLEFVGRTAKFRDFDRDVYTTPKTRTGNLESSMGTTSQETKKSIFREVVEYTKDEVKEKVIGEVITGLTSDDDSDDQNDKWNDVINKSYENDQKKLKEMVEVGRQILEEKGVSFRDLVDALAKETTKPYLRILSTNSDLCSDPPKTIGSTLNFENLQELDGNKDVLIGYKSCRTTVQRSSCVLSSWEYDTINNAFMFSKVPVSTTGECAPYHVENPFGYTPIPLQVVDADTCDEIEDGLCYCRKSVYLPCTGQKSGRCSSTQAFQECASSPDIFASTNAYGRCSPIPVSDHCAFGNADQEKNFLITFLDLVEKHTNLDADSFCLVDIPYETDEECSFGVDVGLDEDMQAEATAKALDVGLFAVSTSRVPTSEASARNNGFLILLLTVTVVSYLTKT